MKDKWVMYASERKTEGEEDAPFSGSVRLEVVENLAALSTKE